MQNVENNIAPSANSLFQFNNTAYKNEYYAKNLVRIRLSLILPPVLFIIFLILDYIFIVEFFEYSLIFRLLGASSTLFCLAWSFHTSYQKYWQAGGISCALFYTTIISVQSYYTVDTALYIYPTALLLAIFWVFLLSRFHFINAVLCSIGVLGIFAVLFFVSGSMPVPIFIAHNFYLIVACVLGGIPAFYVDLADRKAYEQERQLAESEQIRRRNDERFKTILNNMPAAVFLRDNDGHLQLVNSHYERTYGIENGQAAGKKLNDLFSSDIVAQQSKLDKQTLERGGAIHSEHNFLVAGETRFFNSIRFPIYDEDESINGIGGIELDITARKDAENALRTSKERAESALKDLKTTQEKLIRSEKMASLGQLTAGIAHEIKNPLNFVNNFSETSVELLDELKDELQEPVESLDKENREEVHDIFDTLKGDLQKIHHHGSRADSIVKSMLLHARGDSSDLQPTDVNILVEEAIGLAYHGERAKDSSFQAKLDQRLDDNAGEADLVPQEITRVLVNLLTNAFYAVSERRQSEKGSDYIPTVAITTQDLGDSVQFRIWDNGTGMQPEVRKKLFDPFFTTKPTGEGTGLGMSMSFDIVSQQHNGRIEADSEPGEFTEIVITLPRKAEKETGTSK